MSEMWNLTVTRDREVERGVAEVPRSQSLPGEGYNRGLRYMFRKPGYNARCVLRGEGRFRLKQLSSSEGERQTKDV